jgi:hypothetical protein
VFGEGMMKNKLEKKSDIIEVLLDCYAYFVMPSHVFKNK